MGLDFIRIECDITAGTPAPLTSALYNSLRSFEAAFRELCCPDLQKPCANCPLKGECSYRAVFNKTLSSDPEVVRLHQKPSLPFSLYISGIEDNVSTCTIGLTVIGHAINYIGLFHDALLGIVEAGVSTVLPPSEFSLRSFTLDYQNVRYEIIHAGSLSESLILLSGQHILQNTVHSDHAGLIFTSPLRLLRNGSITHQFDFGIFFRSQLRRCSSLFAYYGTNDLDLDYLHLSESAQNVAVFDDKINYTQPKWSKSQSRAGLSGSVGCTGLVEPMLSLLILGSYFNAGKGSAYGSGVHKIEVI